MAFLDESCSFALIAAVQAFFDEDWID